MSTEFPGAGSQHGDMLRKAGVEHYEQLRSESAESLQDKLAAAHDLPERETLAAWIRQAERQDLTGELPIVIDATVVQEGADEDVKRPAVQGVSEQSGEQRAQTVGEPGEEPTEKIFIEELDAPGDPGKDDW